MGAYDYQALTLDGKTRRGVIEADSSRHARQLLRERGLTPLALDQSHQRQAASAHWSFKRWRSPGLPAQQLALITRQLATLIQAGLPLEEVLQAVARQSHNRKLQTLLLAVRGKVLEGHSLAVSLADFPRAFPHLYRATVAAGEHAGHLDKVMNRLADHTEESQQFQQKITMAMIYPCLLTLLSVVMVSGLMVYVVPDVIAVFINSGQTLPTLTVALVALSDVIARYGLWLLLALVAMAFAAKHLLQQPAVRLQFHKALLHWPFVQRFTRGFNTSRYASTLAILTGSGLPLVEAMHISSEVIANDHLKQQLQLATQRVREGGSLHQALEACGYFPPMMLHMIASGEASGELDQMLERTANYQARELQNLISLLVALFEPAMLLLMGLAVLLIVMAILLPILNMNQLVS